MWTLVAARVGTDIPSPMKMITFLAISFRRLVEAWKVLKLTRIQFFLEIVLQSI